MEHQQWNLKINEEEDLQEEWILVNFGSEKVWNRLTRLGKMSPHKNRESHYECGLHNSIHQSPVGPQKWLFLYQSTKFKSHKHTVAWIFHTGLRIHSITWPFQLLVAATASNNEGYIKIHNVWVGAWDQVPHKEQEKKREDMIIYILLMPHESFRRVHLHKAEIAQFMNVFVGTDEYLLCHVFEAVGKSKETSWV